MEEEGRKRDQSKNDGNNQLINDSNNQLINPLLGYFSNPMGVRRRWRDGKGRGFKREEGKWRQEEMELGRGKGKGKGKEMERQSEMRGGLEGRKRRHGRGGGKVERQREMGEEITTMRGKKDCGICSRLGLVQFWLEGDSQHVIKVLNSEEDDHSSLGPVTDDTKYWIANFELPPIY
ncbi:hypothetical protein ACH5RR_014838 [Cinchona calisaya]|uniref:Uncharacterized protein n=1 Tax=Cinchona calisaya TaxID=153742 RepID=A0ABD2ZS89_9GENT